MQKMRKIVFTLLAAMAFLPLAAQDINAVLAEADKLETNLKEMDAFNKYKEVLRIQATNITALWKCSELCSRIGNRQPTKAAKLDYFKAAKTYAELAIQVAPQSADAQYVMAVAMGRQALVLSGKEKVAAVKEIKRYTDEALRLDAKHAKAWHVLGKWHYEVSSLSGIERTAAKILFGGIPKASFEESIAAYEKAKQYSPQFMLNFLELAKAYIKNSQQDKAIALLEKVPSMPLKTEDDARIKAEAKKLLESLQ
jgi:FimV-like protein